MAIFISEWKSPGGFIELCRCRFNPQNFPSNFLHLPPHISTLLTGERAALRRLNFETKKWDRFFTCPISNLKQIVCQATYFFDSAIAIE